MSVRTEVYMLAHPVTYRYPCITQTLMPVKTHTHTHTHTHTCTPQYYSSLPPQNGLLQQERLKCDRRSLSSPPSRTLATALATGHPPPRHPQPSSQLGNSLNFPAGQPTGTSSDLPAQRACHTPSTALASAPLIIHSRHREACSPPRKPILTNSRPLQPSDTRSLGFQGWDSHARALLLSRCSKASSRPVE